jgi:uncharacterized protein
MKFLDYLCWTLLIVGGLNWGLIAVANMDLVATIFGAGTGLTQLIYGLVGLSAAWKLVGCFCNKKNGSGCCR